MSLAKVSGIDDRGVLEGRTSNIIEERIFERCIRIRQEMQTEYSSDGGETAKEEYPNHANLMASPHL